VSVPSNRDGGGPTRPAGRSGAASFPRPPSGTRSP
jgi:hypothetical protein